MFKILQTGFQLYVNLEISDVQAGFRKHIEELEIKCQPSLDHAESKGVPEKHLLPLN